LINNNTIIDSRQISISSVKIFLKWLFCENEKELKNETCEEPLNNSSFKFINSKINDIILDELYRSELEYRKHIAVKGPSCPKLKQRSIDIVVNILKESKYATLFNWNDPVCYSIIMQPLIVSPMINMSDIAISLYNNKETSYDNYDDYVEHCIYIFNIHSLIWRDTIKRLILKYSLILQI
jgi:hypothetical protein